MKTENLKVRLALLKEITEAKKYSLPDQCFILFLQIDSDLFQAYIDGKRRVIDTQELELYQKYNDDIVIWREVKSY